MKTGVSTVVSRNCSVPARTAPSVAAISNFTGVAAIANRSAAQQSQYVVPRTRRWRKKKGLSHASRIFSASVRKIS
jgi:hypothetical protein